MAVARQSFINEAYNNGRAEERFLAVPANKEDLLDSVRCSSGCEETVFFNGVEIQSEVSLHWKVVAVEELAENCVG
jgi:hypothetical protein